MMAVVWDDMHSRFPERVAHLQDRGDKEYMRGLCLPMPIEEAAEGATPPKFVRLRGGWTSVQPVLLSWELNDEWWTLRPVIRAYHRLALSNGAIFSVFYDRLNGGWYRQP